MMAGEIFETFEQFRCRSVFDGNIIDEIQTCGMLLLQVEGYKEQGNQ